MTTNSIVIPPGRLAGDKRTEAAAQLRKRYESDPRATIRSLATETGRSYGLVQQLLAEAGTDLRSRGGTRDSSEKIEKRDRLAAELRREYEADPTTTCRSLGASRGLTENRVYRLLQRAGTTMRSGAPRGPEPRIRRWRAPSERTAL
jgi:hypothetical protein